MRAVGEGDIEACLGGRVASKAQDETAVGRDAHGAPVERHDRAPIGLAAREPTLGETALEAERARGAGKGPQREGQCGGRRPHSSEP